MIRSEETICAPATGISGAISVIRVSGLESLGIVSKIFFPSDKAVNILNNKGFTIVYGDIRSGDEVIDEVLVSIFRSPHSYTGEDSVEISCHASTYIIKTILELLISSGAILALPGEFTRRAFMNGRLDLSQAEAVADVIASSTGSAHRIAMNQMRGGFSAEIAKLRSELLNFASLIELELDFGEEDVEFADRKDLKDIVVRVKNLADSLSESFRIGNAVKNGIPVAIVGKPNSGKSTLLNSLLMEDKAIVSDIPGTTRDTIEDTIVIEGLEFRFIDTAGLRETTDVIESMGIKKTLEKIDQASVILLIDEISDSAGQINKRINAIREKIGETEKRLIVLINKTDEALPGQEDELRGKIDISSSETMLFISAREKLGLEILRKELSDRAIKNKINSDSVIVTNIRHYEALAKVSSSLGRVLEGLDEGIPDDLIATDIRQAIHYLGEITGIITTDEILGNIFKNFCIGK
ncbi:MAG: tRNA uridine-5-carboxymethylaminomethyl(34) synthesis GTPase MnmE [Bacteroidetes bacterium GWF2_41_9]|nr:MAG: tRNA uridine-5-carboxymethylaminomethyl(34) synthesis GTPase MnmE [Bacteroidetes bacterium GWF2_41_9]